MPMTDSRRNLLILVALAVAGAIFTGAFSTTAGSLSAILNLAFAVLLVWFLIASYQRNSGTIAQMDATPRLVLQAAGLALIVVFITGTISFSFLPYPWFGWQSGHAGLFYGALILCGFGLWWSWQQRRSRW
ncbi:MAG: hypothetical protein JWM98_3200 [Thermoleophilia bacterium]|nr:hypothetical protein [Thermoleophilia bacterium]